jgi:murein DD-endopeptidase MepM/ murein hydrolase activator NlpD
LPGVSRGLEQRIAVRLGRSESLQALLHRFELRPGSAQKLLQKIYAAIDLRQMPRDQAVSLIVDPQDRNIRAVEFVLQNQLVSVRESLDGWSVEKQELAHVAETASIRIRVNDNFTRSAMRAGLSEARIAELRRIFSADLDLLADLGAGDEVLLVFPEKQYLDGHVSQGPMAAVRVVHGGQLLDAFGFSGGSGVLQYYDVDGHLLPRAFLTAPVKFERISSTFDMARPDPVTGVLRPHKAIDFQAPQGTPVVAIGPATVDFAGWSPGYGFMVELIHAGGYTSRYAHLSRIGAGIQEGRRVNTGDVIGAVGQTGHATGPHLHFEFARDGEKLDYLSLKIPSTESLSGYKLAQFKREQAKWLAALRDSAVRMVQSPISSWQ